MKNDELISKLNAQTAQINTIAEQVAQLNNVDVATEVVTAVEANQAAIDNLAAAANKS